MPYLSTRHLSRILVLQSLYEWHFDSSVDPESILDRNIETSGYKVDRDFCIKIIGGVVTNQQKIDDIVVKTAPEWPLNQIAIIDLSILRLSIYELILDDEVPPKAVINEAVELGKAFGGENSGKFINGVLGTVYRMSEKFIDDQTVISAGGIVYRKHEGEILYLAIKNAYGKWTFPKGKVDEPETWQEAAVREIREETGIEEAEILGELGEVKFTDKSGDSPIKKTIHFYLIKTEQEHTSPEPIKVLEAKFMNEADLRAKIGYPNLIELIDKAVKIIGEIEGH